MLKKVFQVIWFLAPLLFIMAVAMVGLFALVRFRAGLWGVR